MRSTFYGFEIAKTGLFASQRQIDLTGHNIANANTVGYSRQRLNLSSAELVVGGERFREVTVGYSGAGVRINGVEQVRSAFLDRQYRSENSAYQMWDTRADALGYLEQLFNETQGSTLSTSINAFFTSLQNLSIHPESKENRTNVVQNASLMTDAFNHLYTQLREKLLEQNEAVKTTAGQINDLAKNIAGLNEQIFRYEMSGETATDLRDRRNLLLDELSGLADIQYAEDAAGKLTVTLGGKNMISHNNVTLIDAQPTIIDPMTGAPGLYALSWADDGSAVTAASGKLRAYLDMRDGSGANHMGIPYMVNKLNTLAVAIATEFNAIHAAGYTLPDGVNPSVAGGNFFTNPPRDALGNPVALTAGNFSVDASIRNNVYLIAASSELVTNDTLKGNNKNALAMLALQNRLDVPGIGSIGGYLRGYLAEIGVEANHTNTMRDGQEMLVRSVTNSRLSVSGVSVDEEMTNLIKFQQAYSANARVITAIDEYLDVLINKMGLVGR